jgi:hypothetical protein
VFGCSVRLSFYRIPNIRSCILYKRFSDVTLRVLIRKGLINIFSTRPDYSNYSPARPLPKKESSSMVWSWGGPSTGQSVALCARYVAANAHEEYM